MVISGNCERPDLAGMNIKQAENFESNMASMDAKRSNLYFNADFWFYSASIR